jgi:hypothetical protein
VFRSSAEVKYTWSYTSIPPIRLRRRDGVALGYGLDDRGFESLQGLGIFLFTTASRTALGPTQPPLQCVPGVLSLAVKRPGRRADNSPPFSAEIKNAWSYTSTPPYMVWCLVKHRGNFTFIFCLNVQFTITTAVKSGITL